MNMIQRFNLLSKIGDLAEDMQKEWNVEVSRYKHARAELARIEAEQAERWLTLVKKLRELDRLNARLNQAGCCSTAPRNEHPVFTEEMREALGKSEIEGFGPTAEPGA